MPDPITPRARILIRLKGVLENPANDLAGKSGVAGITVRHTRNRWANSEEMPALSIRMVADEPENDGPVTAWELQHYLAVDLQADAELQTEDSELDPTGLDRLGAMTNAAMAILLDPDATDAAGDRLRDLCDRVVDEGVQPDEDNEADEARFIHRIVVIYRTSNLNPNELLAEGEQLP